MKVFDRWLETNKRNWKIARGADLFSERKAKSLPDDIHLTPSQVYGVLPQSEYMEITGNKVVLNLSGQENMKHVEKDDFIIHLRSFQGGLEHSEYIGKVSSAYSVLIPNDLVYPKYFKYVLKSSGFIQELSSITDQIRDGQSIKFEQFKNIAFALPTIDEQIELSELLEKQIPLINDVIAKKQEQLTLLDELKRSVITNVVTGELALVNKKGKQNE